MFDAITASVIAAAPRLSGVSGRRLPALITDAYVKVAVAKSLLGDELIAQDELFDELRSIGAAQEAIALNLDPSDIRASAAYVAASAYRVLADASSPSDGDGPYLRSDTIGTRIAAMMLYLIADASADAAEVADDIEVHDDEEFPALVATLRRLGRGDVRRSEMARDPFEIDINADAPNLGAMIGYERCADALAGLLAFLSEPRDNESWQPGVFATIALAMAKDVPLHLGNDSRESVSLFAGPWHLARLLDMAEPVLVAASTAAVPPPAGIDASRWRRTLARTARQRPLLWRNHREALEAGLLEGGVSAVLAFPTGAGKSTVSELKVASTVLRNKNVVCLAPTLSLIDQLAKSFRLAVPTARVTAQRDADEELVPAAEGVPEIFVMTPESCLSALGADPSRFGEVGLVVFDEAHLMHSEGDTPTRRSLDASLCFLTLASRFPDSDLMLVSAMFANARELASWLESLTGRAAIALSSPWKPTRQARGALVYRMDEIDRLRAQLADAYRASTNQGPPAAVKREMRAQPHGFFSLKSTWESTNTRDYRLTPLLESAVPLGVSGHRTNDGRWWLTANANQVAARLAEAAADGGLKTLVFTQQVGWTSSIASAVSVGAQRVTPLLEPERRLVTRSTELLGRESALYLRLEDDAVVGTAIPHHGLLLPDERRLHERLFRRRDGVPVLVATSTVTQGMNFPSEFVIIAGDRRFDANVNGPVRLEAHELLNAAGRAGRAGSHANALVLAIPSEVVHYDGGTQMGSGWGQLRTAFSKSDQCVSVRDPIGVLLDGIDAETEPPLLQYLGRRVDSVTDPTIGPGMLRQSFAAFSARSEGDNHWIDRRMAQLAEVFAANSVENWVRQCALISGLPLEDVKYIAERFETQLAVDRDALGWMGWMLDILRERPIMVAEVLRVGSRAALSGAPDELGEWSTPTDNLIEHVRACLSLWMTGATLADIQDAGIERGLARSEPRLEFARKFVLRVVPDLAYLFTLPTLIQNQRAKLGIGDSMPEEHPLAALSRCVELGVDTADKVRLLESNSLVTRKMAHQSLDA